MLYDLAKTEIESTWDQVVDKSAVLLMFAIKYLRNADIFP